MKESILEESIKQQRYFDDVVSLSPNSGRIMASDGFYLFFDWLWDGYLTLLFFAHPVNKVE